MELVAELVKIPHTYLTEVTGMVLVKQDSVVVHATGVTTTSWVLTVLSDTTVPSAHVTALLAVLLEASCHLRISSEHSECRGSADRDRGIRVWGIL